VKRLQGKTADWVIALTVALAGFFLYARTVAPTVLFADSGEYQFAANLAGLAHSTGYPLYIMLGWAWTHLLPMGDVAFRMNLFSALWGAVSLGLVYGAALRALRLAAPDCPLSLRRALSVLTVLLLALSATFWSQVVIAESAGLNAAFVAAVLFLALGFWESAGAGVQPDQPARWLCALAAVYGLSLTHHRTMILLLPALWVPVWAGARRAGLASTAVLRLALPGLILPQLLYLYIPLRAGHTPYAELTLGSGRTLTLYSRSVAGFLDLVLGRAFAGDLASGPLDVGRLGMLLDLALQQFGWVGIGLGLVGLLALVRRGSWLVLTLTGLAGLTYVAFSAIYFIGDVYPLLIPAYLMWALWISLGVWEAARVVSNTVVRGKMSVIPPLNFQHGYQTIVNSARVFAAAPVIVLAFAFPAFLGIHNFAAVDQSHNREAEQMWQLILAQPIPQDAILVSNDRDEIMPLWYYQYVAGQRPDVLGLFPLIVRDPAYRDVSGVIDQALATGRPVFLIKPMPGLELKYRLEPTAGPLVRVDTSYADARPMHPLDLTLGDAMHLVGYDLAPERPAVGQSAQVTLYWQPLHRLDKEYSSFVHFVNLPGKTIIKDDHSLGGVYYPTNQWKTGEALLDTHWVAIPSGTASGAYSLTVGLYAWPSMERPGPDVVIDQVTF
jgi:hypothetical protein